jgi:hypothetical protein
MAELADAADSKSAGTWYLGGSIPPPGTSLKHRTEYLLPRSFFTLNSLLSHVGHFFPTSIASKFRVH